MEVYLSFIGIGLSATIPSLGRMISQAQSAFRTFPWEFWPPVLVASMVTIILYLLGQNLADAVFATEQSFGGYQKIDTSSFFN